MGGTQSFSEVIEEWITADPSQYGTTWKKVVTQVKRVWKQNHVSDEDNADIVWSYVLKAAARVFVKTNLGITAINQRLRNIKYLIRQDYYNRFDPEYLKLANSNTTAKSPTSFKF